jgi:hypothetical protein
VNGPRRTLPALAVLVVGAAVVGAAVLAGCSRSTDAAGTRGADAGASAPARARPTEPPGSDADAVGGYVEGLLSRYDDAVNAIIAEPAAVRERAQPAVQAYLDVFEPGSEAADDALAGWAESADAGITVRPLRAGSQMIVSRLDGRVETLGDDEVRFATCADHRYRQYDGRGVLQDIVDTVGRAGEGIAVRVDGEWRLRKLELRDDRPACATEGGST